MFPMRRPQQLPPNLQDRAFTRADLRSLELSEERVRRRDVRRLTQGLYTAVSEQGSLSDALELARTLPECWVSHATAARLYGWDLPRRLGERESIHLTQPRGSNRRIRRLEVISHRQAADAEDQWMIAGARVASPARTWLDLAGELGEVELICFGDHLVRHPYPRFEARREPYTTIRELHVTLARANGVPGRRRALEAVRHVRVGADSAAETRLRLSLVRAGLPEPSLQVPVHPGDLRARCADLGYPDLKIAIQYEGATHFTAEQAMADQRRDNVFLAAGWIVLRFNARDHAEGFASAVRQVRGVIARRRG
ncbi:hypothetical protein AVL63_07695 [Nesterenkonia jeotgali]|uniref:DUF559 domain-containing protein n=1 Tax=Nesterenkonia jeotgali TaxID=317018 RepID=A0A0W8IJP2_9MICC|nr:hypothetical protein AVL63_07695 [Nesterenkonia jeotgali]